MISYKAIGRGPKVVVLLHDWLGDSTNYDATLPYLSQDEFTWLLPDLRGYGASRHLDAAFTLKEATTDIIALLDSLNIKEFSVAGHSMTGLVALRLALDHPQRVQKAILASPVLAGGLKLDDAGRGFFEKAAVDTTTCREVVGVVTSGRYTKTWLELKARKAAETSLPEARLGYLHNMLLVSDFSSELPGLQVPLLTITGSFDADGFKDAAVREALKPVAALTTFSDVTEAGHYPMQEAPVRYASLVQAFLNS